MRGTWPRHVQPVWDGSGVAGRRVLVRCYHGLGDTVQFIRFAAPLRAAGGRGDSCGRSRRCASWWRRRPGWTASCRCTTRAPEVAYDVDVEVMELPHLFRTDLGTLPAAVPYLYVAGTARPAGPSLNGADRLHVGVVWRAGDWDDRRSVPVRLLAERLADVPGVQWHVLQQGPGLAERPASFGVAPPGPATRRRRRG